MTPDIYIYIYIYMLFNMDLAVPQESFEKLGNGMGPAQKCPKETNILAGLWRNSLQILVSHRYQASFSESTHWRKSGVPFTQKRSTTLQGTSPYPTLGKGQSSSKCHFGGIS